MMHFKKDGKGKRIVSGVIVALLVLTLVGSMLTGLMGFAGM